MKKKNIAIFHPQINNFGGGEYLSMCLASGLKKEYNLTVITTQKTNSKKIQDFFDIDLEDIEFKQRKISKLINKIPSLKTYKSSLMMKTLNDLEKYDLVIDTGTNGWFSKNLKTKTICYVHFPYFQPLKKGIKKITNKLLIQAEDAFKYDLIVCNSRFTKNHLKTLTKSEIKVVYPPVEIQKVSQNVKKQKYITTIGRFSPEKKHEVMIDTFKKMNLPEWELHIIGAFNEDSSAYNKKYLESLKEAAKGHKIFFHININHDEVLKFISKSSIYWHARGYGEKDPVEYENFGITTVEAMAAGCVPIVINLGAQPEIVQHKKSGFCWNTPIELKNITNKVIKDKKLTSKIVKEAIKRSKDFTYIKFNNQMLKEVKKLVD